MHNNYYEIDTGKGCLGSVKGIVIGLLICLLLTLCTSSCRSVKHYVQDTDSIKISKVDYKTLNDSVSTYRSRLLELIRDTKTKDSVYTSHKDSTIVLIKGDSTIIEHWYHDTTYKESFSSSTLIESLTDSINMYKGTAELYYQRLDSILSHSKEEKVVVEKTPWHFNLKILFIFFIVLLVFLIYTYYKKRF